MLLTSLHPKSPDLADAVRIGEDSWGRGDLVGAATAAAERIGGASGPIAVLARPSIDTILAVVAGLIAGVPIVPVPADVGIAERRHILADSAAVAWLGESPDESEDCPTCRCAGTHAHGINIPNRIPSRLRSSCIPREPPVHRRACD